MQQQTCPELCPQMSLAFIARIQHLAWTDEIRGHKGKLTDNMTQEQNFLLQQVTFGWFVSQLVKDFATEAQMRKNQKLSTEMEKIVALQSPNGIM